MTNTKSKAKGAASRTKRSAGSQQRGVKRHFKRCNWMMQSNGWKDCGCKATWHARGIGSYYCTKHRSHVSGWRYDLVPLNDKLRHSAPAEDSDNTKNV